MFETSLAVCGRLVWLYDEIKFVNDKYIENKINKINKNNYASGVVQKTRNVQQSRIFLFHSQIRPKKCW